MGKLSSKNHLLLAETAASVFIHLGSQDTAILHTTDIVINMTDKKNPNQMLHIVDTHKKIYKYYRTDSHKKTETANYREIVSIIL